MAESCVAVFSRSSPERRFLEDISQGRMATRLRCDGIFNYHFIANLSQSLKQWKNFENRLRFDKVIDISWLPRFLWNTVYISLTKCAWLWKEPAFVYLWVLVFYKTSRFKMQCTYTSHDCRRLSWWVQMLPVTDAVRTTVSLYSRTGHLLITQKDGV